MPNDSPFARAVVSSRLSDWDKSAARSNGSLAIWTCPASSFENWRMSSMIPVRMRPAAWICPIVSRRDGGSVSAASVWARPRMMFIGVQKRP